MFVNLPIVDAVIMTTLLPNSQIVSCVTMIDKSCDKKKNNNQKKNNNKKK